LAAWPAPAAAAGAGAPLSGDGLATIRALAARLSITTGLVFGGLIIATLAVFLPLATVTVMGMNLADASFPWLYKLIVLASIAGSAALAWPALSGVPIDVGRRTGLSVLTGLMVVVVIIAFFAVSQGDQEGAGIAAVSPGFGLMLYVAAVIAIIVGVIRLWMQPAQTPGPIPPAPPPPNAHW
jgi:hypothetical protein